jgi:uncharacterized coiled-coil protein SlyX
MSAWSPAETIAMERRHIKECEARIVRQEALVLRINEQLDQFVATSKETLRLLRESLEISKNRLQDLEQRYGSAPDH